MINFITQNVATIIVCSMLAIVITLIINKLVKDHKSGKSSCGCSCNSCPAAGMCHKH